MDAVVWHNQRQKAYFASPVGRGRPLPQNAASYEGSRRELYQGETRQEALDALFAAQGGTVVEIVKADS